MGFFDLLERKQRGSLPALRWVLNTSGEWIYPDEKANDYIEKGYKQLPTPYGLISAILKKSTIVPFEVFKVKSKSKEMKYKSLMKDPRNTIKALKYKNEAYDKIEDSEIERLLLNPNSYQSLNELWWEVDGYKLLTGNSYLYGIEVGSKPKELHNIPAPCVEIKVEGTPFDPILKYIVNYIEGDLPGAEVYHFKYWNPILSTESPTHQFKGQSPLQSCRMLLGRYKDADITQGFMFKNQGPAGVLSGDGSSDAYSQGQEQAIAIKDRFKQQHQGVHRANDVIVTPSKLSWTSIGLSPVDLNITAGKKEMIEELSNAYNYPAELLGGDKKFNNYEQARRAELTDAVIPLVEDRKSVLNKLLCPKFGEDIRIEFDYTIFPELQDDLEKQSKTAKEMYWVSLNEKRAFTGYDQSPDPNMDKIYVPSGLTPLEDLNLPPEEIDEEMLNPEITEE